MGKYFGTDGFRGEAGVTLTSEHAYKIGRFLGWYYSKKGKNRVRVVIGKDTRISSYMLEYAIASGLTSSGADAYILHVTTTPSVSYVVSSEDFDCGIMISASHNPYYDNGIKIVNSRGEKIDDETIEKIELYLDNDLKALNINGADLPFARGENIGRIVDYYAGRNRYIGYLISLSPHSFKNFKVGLDCANGGAWMIAKCVFDALGAKTYTINNSPNGININNDSGSTHIEKLVNFVKENSLDVGFAFDGDADRCIAVDENGNIVNGDHIMYVLASRLKKNNELINNTVVTTIMSNMGLYKAFDEIGIEYEKTKVGDRYVYENMQKNGNCIGGEQSGHIILSKYATTGDGILTKDVKMFPQVIKNVKVSDKRKIIEDNEVRNMIKNIEEKLKDCGRVVLRESGTEPVLRVMIEAVHKEDCEFYANQIVDFILSKD